MESVSWADQTTQKRHYLSEEGHLFRWVCSYEDDDGKTISLDYGLVPGGCYVAVLHLTQQSGGQVPSETRSPAP